MDIGVQKKILREKFKKIRKSFPNKSILDNLIFENLVKNIDFSKYQSVIVYVSFGIEVDTLKLIEYLRNKNIKIYSPKCYIKDKSMRFFNINGENSLIEGAYGILEPLETSQELLDFSNCICIVPALSFDNFGYRLGWGGGYYDRFLSNHMDIFKIGLVYNECLSNQIPRDIYDVSVDLVLTEKNIIITGGQNEY